MVIINAAITMHKKAGNKLKTSKFSVVSIVAITIISISMIIMTTTIVTETYDLVILNGRVKDPENGAGEVYELFMTRWVESTTQREGSFTLFRINSHPDLSKIRIGLITNYID
jgi:hypothetical protein